MAPIVIIGTGHAGVMLGREFRKRDAETPLLYLTADDGAAYYKPNLSKALADGKQPDALVMQSPDKLGEVLNASVRANCQVSKIDPAAQHVELTGGERIAYSKLVLALGADPVRLPFEGSGAGEVRSVNDLLDYRSFRDNLPAGGRVAIIGAGLIGSEFANDLAATDHVVHLIDLADWPLSRLLPQPLGQALGEALAEGGVHLHLGQSVKRIERNGETLSIETSGGDAIQADIVLSAVGLAPRTMLASAAGIHCNRGVVVDDHLATNAADVYSLGDCAEIGGHVLPYIMPATHAARALAATLAGEATPLSWPAMPVVVKTPMCPTVVCPPSSATGSWGQIEGEGRDLSAIFTDDAGQACGFALTGAATRRRGELAKLMPPLLKSG
jgi:rubredoxin-NAD+ reductase